MACRPIRRTGVGSRRNNDAYSRHRGDCGGCSRRGCPELFAARPRADRARNTAGRGKAQVRRRQIAGRLAVRSHVLRLGGQPERQRDGTRQHRQHQCQRLRSPPEEQFADGAHGSFRGRQGPVRLLCRCRLGTARHPGIARRLCQSNRGRQAQPPGQRRRHPLDDDHRGRRPVRGRRNGRAAISPSRRSTPMPAAASGTFPTRSIWISRAPSASPIPASPSSIAAKPSASPTAGRCTGPTP